MDLYLSMYIYIYLYVYMHIYIHTFRPIYIYKQECILWVYSNLWFCNQDI